MPDMNVFEADSATELPVVVETDVFDDETMLVVRTAWALGKAVVIEEDEDEQGNKVFRLYAIDRA